MTALTHFIVLDFEATCDGDDPPTPQEIIEFPSVLVRADTFETVDEFEAFVRPAHHPTLTSFCTGLTSITQDDVDAAPSFSEVYDRYLTWIASHGLPVEGELPYALVTCGDWDLLTMLPLQFRVCDPPVEFVPEPFRRWINLKVPFKHEVGAGVPTGMASMLEALSLPLVGHHHRGIDDCRNIAQVLRTLAKRGVSMDFTRELAPSRYPTINIVLDRNSKRVNAKLTKRALKTLLGLASSVFRKQAREAHIDGVRVRSDAPLAELRPGDTVRIA